MTSPRLKELHDYSWYPSILREYMTDFLAFFALHFFQYNPVFPLIAKILKEHDIHHLHDFCSGAASCIPRLEAYLNGKEDCKVRIELCDKYPNYTAFKRVSSVAGSMIAYSFDPVDALEFSSTRKEFRVMFSAVHHFTEEELGKMIRTAINDECSIGFFDYATRNHWRTLLLMPGLIPMIWCVTPFLRPFSWTRLLLTYILPLVPVLIFIDGFISRWNGYTKDDFDVLKKLAEELGWKSECGTVPNFFHSGEVLYFICHPSGKHDNI